MSTERFGRKSSRPTSQAGLVYQRRTGTPLPIQPFYNLITLLFIISYNSITRFHTESKTRNERKPVLLESVGPQQAEITSPTSVFPFHNYREPVHNIDPMPLYAFDSWGSAVQPYETRPEFSNVRG